MVCTRVAGWALGASLLLAAADPIAAFAGSAGMGLPCSGVRATCPTAQWAMVMTAGKKSAVTKALQKTTGALTVSVEFAKPTDKVLSDLELALLSMQLRKTNAASLWTADVELLSRVAAEQKTAKGNFPGPMPLIFNGDSAHLEAAASAGAGAVVLGAGEQDKAASASRLGLDVIWAIDSADEAGPLVAAGIGKAFLLKSGGALDLVEALPKEALKIASIASMQSDNAEISTGRELGRAGCKAVLMEKAVVGDSEDVHYTSFCIDGITSKASSEFKITGVRSLTKKFNVVWLTRVELTC